MLSVYTQPWGSLLAEAEAPSADHAIKRLSKGDRLEVAFNHTLCFAAALADRYELCFEIVDLTDLEHVRFENRGCGTLEQTGVSQTIPLNDAATFHVTARFAPLNERVLSSGNTHLQMWVLLGTAVVLLTVLAALFSVRRELAYRFPGCALALAQTRDRSSKRLIRTADDLGMPGLASWLSRTAAGQHAPLARRDRQDGSKINLEMQMSTWDEEGLDSPESRAAGTPHSEQPESRGRATRAALDRVRVTPIDSRGQKAPSAPAKRPAQPGAPPAEPASDLLASIGDILSQSNLLQKSAQSSEPWVSVAPTDGTAPPKLSPPPASAEPTAQDSWSDIGATQRASREPVSPAEDVAESEDEDDAVSGLTMAPLQGGGALEEGTNQEGAPPPKPRRPTKRVDMVNSLD